MNTKTVLCVCATMLCAQVGGAIAADFNVSVEGTGGALTQDPSPWGPCFNTQTVEVTNNTSPAGTITVTKTPSGEFASLLPGQSTTFNCINACETINATFLALGGGSGSVDNAETGTCNSASAPSLTTWSLCVLALLIVASGVIAVRKTRALRST